MSSSLELFAKEREPKKLIVFGAGLDEVNGTYHIAGRNKEHDTPVYTKAGQWKEKAVAFVIECGAHLEEKADKKTVTWYICAGDHQTMLYVSNSESLESSQLPPARHWLTYNTLKEDPKKKLPQCPLIILSDDEKMRDWRQPADESFADYKIEILRKQDDKVDVKNITTNYNVHRVILASASNYFDRLFAGNQEGRTFAEAHEHTSRIALSSDTADMFPYLLDHMYWQYSCKGAPSPLPKEGDNIMHLYWLADYFELPRLRLDLERKLDNLKESMTLSTCSSYISAATELGVQHAIDAGLEFCKSNLNNFEDDGDDLKDLAKGISTTFLQDMLKEDVDPKGRRKHSQLVAYFCASHSMDATTFQSLKAQSLCPSLT